MEPGILRYLDEPLATVSAPMIVGVVGEGRSGGVGEVKSRDRAGDITGDTSACGTGGGGSRGRGRAAVVLDEERRTTQAELRVGGGGGEQLECQR